MSDIRYAGWTKVADAVHAEGGTVFMPLMNGGRVTHPNITGTDRIVAPSAIAIDGETRLADGSKVPCATPHALETAELASVRDEFVAADRPAVDAGIDGVESHGANGYLLHEFLSPAQPAHRRVRRTARGPHPLRHRGREAVAAEVDAERVGIRISRAVSLSPHEKRSDLDQVDNCLPTVIGLLR